MSKIRVYELAKELGIDNKELITRLEKLGIAVRAHSSTLEEEEIQRVRKEVALGEKDAIVEERVRKTVIRRRAVRQSVTDMIETPVESQSDAEDTALQAEPQDSKILEDEEPLVRAESEDNEERPEAEARQVEPKEPEEKRSHVEVASPEPKDEKELSGVNIEKDQPQGLAGAANDPVKAVPVEDTRNQGEDRKDKRKGIIEKKPRRTSAIIVRHIARKDLRPTPAPAPAPKPASAPASTHARPTQSQAEKVTPQRERGRVAPTAITPAVNTAEKAPTKPLSNKIKKPVEVHVGDDVRKKKTFLKRQFDKKGKRFKNIESEDDRRNWREEKPVAVAKMKRTEITTPKAIKRRVKIEEAIKISDLARKMGVKASDLIAKLVSMGMMVTINQSIDIEAATIVAGEFGYQVEAVRTDYEDVIQREVSLPANLKPRAPVVTIMGHVDHGKTSLLDVIRQTHVIDGESGGITQAIGAYHVHINNRDIVFLDTPGHEAFTAMRARGAQVTDIVVLVVAADDGVMDQTVEAINHSRAAGVPIIVAVNKIDKANAEPDRIKQQLTEYELVPEAWGGDTIYAEVSAKQNLGIEELMEMILLQADIMELTADPDRLARGVVVEAKLDRGRGPVATVIIQEGTLREGDAIVSKMDYGRVRAMTDDKGRRVNAAGPSMPVEVVGFSGVPQVGMDFVCVEDEKRAKSIGEFWLRKEREKELSMTSKVTLEQLYARIQEGAKDLKVIVKADVQGSVEALSESLIKLSTDDVRLKLIHGSAGAVTETDVMLASASDAVIIGFKVRPDARVSELAENEGVSVKLYDVIYDAIADVRNAMEGLLEPVYEETVQGRAEVLQVFRVSKVGTIAGSRVTDGKITRSARLRLLRDGVVIYEGAFLSLKRFKDDAKEVLSGFECGIGIDGFNDMKEGDVIETYTKEAVARKL